jgi:hypothetical protein
MSGGGGGFTTHKPISNLRRLFYRVLTHLTPSSR